MIAIDPVAKPAWENAQTDETQSVKSALANAGFERVDAYRYNSAVIRVRIVDSRFEGKTYDERDRMVEPILDQLPERTNADIVTLLTFAPSELVNLRNTRERLLNLEFEDYSLSGL